MKVMPEGGKRANSSGDNIRRRRENLLARKLRGMSSKQRLCIFDVSRR